MRDVSQARGLPCSRLTLTCRVQEAADRMSKKQKQKGERKRTPASDRNWRDRHKRPRINHLALETLWRAQQHAGARRKSQRRKTKPAKNVSGRNWGTRGKPLQVRFRPHEDNLSTQTDPSDQPKKKRKRHEWRKWLTRKQRVRQKVRTRAKGKSLREKPRL